MEFIRQIKIYTIKTKDKFGALLMVKAIFSAGSSFFTSLLSELSHRRINGQKVNDLVIKHLEKQLEREAIMTDLILENMSVVH